MSDRIIRADGNGFQPGRRYFVLEEDSHTVRQVPVVCEADFIEWQKEACTRYRVDRLVICESPEIVVATYFLGHDDESSGGRPQPWETSIAGSPLDGQNWQYATVGEAKQGHWRAVDLVRDWAVENLVLTRGYGCMA